MILRRSFPALTLFMLPIFVASLALEFLRPTLSFGILVIVSFVSIVFSIAAGVTNTILGVELGALLTSIERRSFGDSRPVAREGSPVTAAVSAAPRDEAAGATSAHWE
jgi:hypothetical protein